MFSSSKTLLRVAALTAAAIALFAFSGCQTVQEQPLAAKAAVQFTVMNEIEHSSDRVEKAKSIIEIAAEAGTLMDVESVTLAEVKTKIMQRLVEKELEPSRMLAASFLVDAIGAELQRRIGEGVLSPEDKVTVNQVLGWVKEAAGFYVPKSP